MRILFIENRYRTLFWRIIADRLRNEGHEVKFIVQNKSFRNHYDRYNEYIIPYPKNIVGDTQDIRNFGLIKSDRNLNYFRHKGSAHYDYYRIEITKAIEHFNPDMVFGESTAFHELITIDICKTKGIIYLQPSTTRYPLGRFAFYKYDTLEPYKGSGEKMQESDCRELIKSIVNRTTKPDYMVIKKPSINDRIKRAKELIKHTLSYYLGEHYNTPNPIIKKKIESRKKIIINEWDKLAQSRMTMLETDDRFRILYPLQMQPEANIDVWGKNYRNQLDTIRKIAENTSDDIEIIVKPNPKSKYELTSEMIDFIKSNPRIIPILHPIPMGYVLTKTDMVITVTGTIAIECILSNKPVLTLVKTLNNYSGNCVLLTDFKDIEKHVNLVKTNNFPTITEDGKIEFLNILNSTGYKGLPYENFQNEDNINWCLKGFDDVLNSIGTASTNNSD